MFASVGLSESEFSPRSELGVGSKAVELAELLYGDTIAGSYTAERIATFYGISGRFRRLGAAGSRFGFSLIGGEILLCVSRVSIRVEVSRLLVSVFVEGVFVSVDGLVGEVENRGWVDGITHEASFEVEVGAEASAGVAA